MQYRTVIALSMFLCSQQLFADSVQQGVDSSQQNTPTEQIPNMYNRPTFPWLSNGVNLSVRGDLLIWQATEDNLLNCYVIDANFTTPRRGFNEVDFEWDCGVRLGLDYALPFDGWDLSFDWTHFITDADSTVKNKGGDHIPSPVWGAAFFNESILLLEKSKAHWHLRLDQFDLNLGRSYWVGNYFTVRPNFGLRATWIHQKLNLDYISTTPSLSIDGALKNHFWGLGLTLGASAEWLFSKSWSLFGTTDYALLFGDFDIDQRGRQAGREVWKQTTDFDTGKSVLDFAAGFKYQRLFHQDRFGLTLRAGYEYHLYFNQNQFLVSNGNDGFENFTIIRGNLAFQGVMISGQFDF